MNWKSTKVWTFWPMLRFCPVAWPGWAAAGPSFCWRLLCGGCRNPDLCQVKGAKCWGGCRHRRRAVSRKPPPCITELSTLRTCGRLSFFPAPKMCRVVFVRLELQVPLWWETRRTFKRPAWAHRTRAAEFADSFPPPLHSLTSPAFFLLHNQYMTLTVTRVCQVWEVEYFLLCGLVRTGIRSLAESLMSKLNGST